MKRTAIAALLALACSPAAAQGSCLPRADALAQLAEKYGETPYEIGLAADGAVLELIASEEGRTWTILRTTPDGRTCTVAAGEAWMPVSRVVIAPGRDG